MRRPTVRIRPRLRKKSPKNKPLEDWNDQSARTKEEVLAYLNKFAEERDPQPVLP